MRYSGDRDDDWEDPPQTLIFSINLLYLMVALDHDCQKLLRP